MNEMYRQGDILLVRVNDYTGYGDLGSVTVGFGEESGHSHVVENATKLTGDELAWDLFSRTGEWQEDGYPLIEIGEGGAIKHEEHNELELVEGIYHVIRQREYDYSQEEDERSPRPRFD